MRGQGSAVVKAKGDVLLSLCHVWDKRLVIQARRKATCADIWRVLDKSLPPEPWRRSLSRLRQSIARRLTT
jgi:hypothetical protein